MRAPLIRLSCLLSLLIASSASAVTMDWTPIGNSGNACDPQIDPYSRSPICVGAVNYGYQMGTYEVTNGQYAEFLNAKAKSDPLGLYNPAMGDPSTNNGCCGRGGIARSGIDGSYTYAAIAGRENMPVIDVSFYDALRFANWMNNGQGLLADTETGSYILLGGTPTPSNGSSAGTRTPLATIVLPNDDEWYKAAYHSPAGGAYFDYPAGSDTQTTCAAPGMTPNTANCFHINPGDLTPVGSYTGSASPYGTFDQGGNVREWNETRSEDGYRIVRGGGWIDPGYGGYLAAAFRDHYVDYVERFDTGFRIAMIPEPGTGLLVIAGLLGLAGWRSARA